MTGEACLQSRERVHRLHDGDLLDAADRRGLEDHLGACRACREFRDEIEAMLDGLRATPIQPFDDRRLDQVWARTTRAARPSRAPVRRSIWVPWAAAAVLAIGLVSVFWLSLPPGPPTPSELRQAAREARFVLSLASRGLNKTEQTAVTDVLGAEISGALRRVPIEWPRGVADRRRES